MTYFGSSSRFQLPGPPQCMHCTGFQPKAALWNPSAPSVLRPLLGRVGASWQRTHCYSGGGPALPDSGFWTILTYSFGVIFAGLHRTFIKWPTGSCWPQSVSPPGENPWLEHKPSCHPYLASQVTDSLDGRLTRPQYVELEPRAREERVPQD